MLTEISRVLSGTLDLHAVYESMYEQISRVMDASMFFIALALHNGRVALPYVREFGRLTRDVETPAGNSVTSHVVELGEELLFQTARQYERYAVAHGLPVIVLGDQSRGPSEAMLYVPLNTGRATIGTLSVQSTEPNAYTQSDLETVTVIASQAAIAIQNARLYEATVSSARRRQALLRVAEMVNGTLELQAVLDAILDGIGEVMPYYLAAILLPNRRAGVLDTVGGAGHLAEERRLQIKVPFGLGVTGKVFETGDALRVSDVSSYEGYIVGSEDVRSEVAVPLIRGGEVIGVLNVERAEPDGFSDEDVELLTLFASQAATAIENARLFDEQRTRVLEMQGIQQLVKEMTGQNEYGSMTTVVEAGLRQLVDVDECIIYAWDEATGVLRPISVDAGSRGGRPALSLLERRKLGEGIAAWVVQAGHSAVFDSTRSDPRLSQDARSFACEMSVIAVPMMHDGSVIGVITVGKEGSCQFDESVVRVVELVAGHAAIGYDRCRLYEELQVQATTDALTGLFNRRYLSKRLHEEKSRALRNDHPLAGLMIDADDFKSVNDAYGHDAGDVVLKDLAMIIRTETRTEDIVVRYGGEEFFVLLPEVEREGAIALAERLRSVISESQLAPGAAVRQVRVSVGVAELHPDDAEEEILSRCDAAMYEAKRNGGNRVFVWERHGCVPGRPHRTEECVSAA